MLQMEPGASFAVTPERGSSGGVSELPGTNVGLDEGDAESRQRYGISSHDWPSRSSL